MRKKHVDMLSGSVFKGLLSMAIPIMVMNVMQSLFNIMDMTSLRIFSDDSSVGAVGVCGTLITLCTSLLIGTSSGANVIVAKRIGSGDRERTDKAASTAILTSIFGGILLMIIGITFAETFLRMINCPESLLEKATLYFRIYFAGVPIILFYNFAASILRATGDTKRPMYFLILAGFLKVIFTVLFLTIFDMTVDGVAYATILSQLIASILAFLAMRQLVPVVNINFKKLKFDFTEFKDILFIGIPTGMQSALYSLANAVITTAVNSFGAAATTGIAIANQFDGILYQISCAPALAVIPYIAQNVGAGNIKRVKEAVFKAMVITTGFGVFFGSLSAFFSAQLSSIMSSSPEVIAYSQQKMIIISSTYFICGINEIMGGALKGMGKPILPTIATLLYMCLFRFVWVYGIFPLCPNLTFLYLVWPIGWVLSIITLLIAYFPAISKLQKQYS